MAEEITHQLKISGPGLDQTFDIPPGITTIGRQDTNHLVLIHPLVSRHHAELVCAKDACTITDLGSMHGTMVNRERLEPNAPVTLNSGDVVEIGAFRLVYEGAARDEPLFEEEVVSAEGDEPVVEETDEPAVEETGEPAVEETAVSLPEPTPQPIESQPIPSPQPVQTWGTAKYTPTTSFPTPAQPSANGHTKFMPPAGLSLSNSSYLNYLPDIYYSDHNNFITRFLALLESILAPIEWNVDNFDLFLDPTTTPAGFLPWLANWFNLHFDHTWNEETQRQLLEEAYLIYRRRGTAWALQRILEIYTGKTIEIDDQNRNLDALTFSVRVEAAEREMNRTAIEHIINGNKPAHTNYSLLFIS